MRKIVRASLLLLALSCAAQAGHIPNDDKPPTPPSTVEEPTTEGHIPNDEPQTVVEAILNLLVSFGSLV